MTTYTIELQRPYGVVASRTVHKSHRWALHTMTVMVKACREHHGLVLVFKDGREITYAAMRGLEV